MRWSLSLLLPLVAAQQSLPWLTVRAVDASLAPGSARRFVIADEFGREVTLRGACFEAEERNLLGLRTQRSVDPADYEARCPENFQSYQEPPICGVDAGVGRFRVNASDGGQNDFAQARACEMVFLLCRPKQPEDRLLPAPTLSLAPRAPQWVSTLYASASRGQSSSTHRAYVTPHPSSLLTSACRRCL